MDQPDGQRGGHRAGPTLTENGPTAGGRSSGTPLLLSDGTANYLYGPAGIPVEQTNDAGTSISYLQHDEKQSTRLLTSPTGAVTGTYSYTPDGQTTGHTGTASTNLLYNGQYQDSETGLYYLRARYYDPTTAQFLTRDPLEAETGAPYSYAGDDPIDNSDPSGLCWPSWACGAENAVGGATSGVWNATGGQAVATVEGVVEHGRLPDYYSLCGSASPFPVLPGGCLTITRHGHLYGSVQDSLGTVGGSFQARAGWIDTSQAPSSCQIDSFVTGTGVTASGFQPVWPDPLVGVGPAVAETWGHEGQGGSGSFGTEVGIGFGTPSYEIGQSRAWHIHNF